MAEVSIEAAKGKLFYGHIDPKDDAGNEVPIDDGSEIYSSSDETIFTVAANPKNPKYFIGTLTGLVGVAKVQVSINPDPAAGTDGSTNLISDAAIVTVTPDLATSVNLTFDAEDDAPDTSGAAPVTNP